MGSGTDTFVEKTSQLYQDYDHLFLNIFYTQSMVVLVENGDITAIDAALALLATFIVFPPALVYLDTWRDRRLGIAMPETNEVY
ncbi:hypothetical protein [Methanococcoides vulcani]|uniref:hypothetical protein n=1 Tax=Methanococcoides vulcani TaxID=1353158 RepID=UPI000B861975|nr:hypothetical protein [Methanococcoides vulcani]